ncbi:MAG TPA: cyclic nucleotide-binding domain-containing protein [Pirellulales bacterium]|nr:cyclic nucleotide-binding domain-containing protein [Pirellulales bacterium]
MSSEADEFEALIGDQLVTVGRSHADLLRQGTIDLEIDGHKVTTSRVKTFADATGKVISTRLMTIYDAATQLYDEQLKEKNPIPLLCHREHMTPAAVCRVCMVEVKGQPRLAPACQRPIEPGMTVSTIITSRKVQSAVKILTELLVADHIRPRETGREYGENELALLAERLHVTEPRFPKATVDRGQDESSLVIAVDHNACILCDRCVRACDEVRRNNVIGRMGKGYSARIAFDLNDPMGNSSCVACGECMISCPTGALTNRAVVDLTSVVADSPGAKLVPAAELAENPLFAGISRPFLEWNRGAVIRRTYKKGEVICREGEFGSTAFVMERGKFEVRIRSPLSHVASVKKGLLGIFGHLASSLTRREGDGGAAVRANRFIHVDAPVSLEYGDPVAILTPDDVIFGEMTCMSHYPRSATVTAAEDCTVLEILRNVLYMLQRNKASKRVLDDLYRRRSLETHLKSVRIFSEGLDDKAEFGRFVDFLRNRVQLIRVHPGQVIFRQGDRADHFYMVRVGFVKVSQSRLGGEHVLNYIGPGGYFGEIGLLAHLPEIQGLAATGVRTATCTALDHVDLVRVGGDDFRELVEAFPTLRRQLAKLAVERLEENERVRTQIEHVPLAEFLSQGLMNAQSLLVLDLEKCTRCDECTKACADAHDGVTRLIREGLRFDQFLVTSSCRSCLDPYCMVGCPVGSIRRRNSREIVIEDWCIGCGKCAQNCPYGNINMHGFITGEQAPDPQRPERMIPVVRQKATTCDLCASVDGQPSCVYACPHDAAHRMSGTELLDLVDHREG